MENTEKLWLERNGFSTDGKTFMVCGGNTYFIKDYLKEQGYIYSPTLKWHGAKEIELSKDYTLISFDYLELCDYDAYADTVCYKPNTTDVINAKIAKTLGYVQSEYIGVVGERQRDVEVNFVSQRIFNGRYGPTKVITFTKGNDMLVWFTMTNPVFPQESKFKMSFTVKSYDLYNGVKSTIVTRCTFK